MNGYNTDHAFFAIVSALWDNNKVLVLIVAGYALICGIIWLYLHFLVGDHRIDRLSPPERDIRELLRIVRKWIVANVTGGWAALVISVLIVIISLPFSAPEVDADPVLVQIAGFSPVIVIAFSQLWSQFKGAMSLRKYVE